MWKEVKKLIRENSSFLLTSHINPDGDGLGSAAFLLELLLSLGKKARFVSPNAVPEKFTFLDKNHLFEEYDEQQDYHEQVLIVLDAHSLDRIGPIAKIVNNKPKIKTLAIDHHPISHPFAKLNVIDDRACSVGAMLYTLAKEFGYEPSLEAAQGLYTSVICDTGRFSYSCTNRKAHKIADECIKLGVDPDFMYSQLFQKVSLAEFNVFKKAIQRMKLYFDDTVIVHKILLEDYQDTGVNLHDLDYIHDFNKALENIECIIVLSELSPSQTRISLRSNGYLDTGSLMRELGGGGHSKAAGVSLQVGIEQAQQIVLELVKDKLVQNSSDEYMMKSK